MKNATGHLYITATILFTVYSQLVMRWQVGLAGPLPDATRDKVSFVTSLLINPWVITALITTFLAGVSWMLAMSKVELSYAFPFLSLNFLIVLAAGVVLFDESLTINKLIGTALIISGIAFLAAGQSQ